MNNFKTDMIKDSIELNVDAMLEHMATSCLSSKKLTGKEAYRKAYEILAEHFEDYYERHLTLNDLAMDQFTIRLLCPYCNHNCEHCLTVRADHLHGCIHDRLIEGFDKHLESQDCCAPMTVIEDLDNTVVWYRELRQKSPSEQRSEMHRVLKGFEYNLYRFVKLHPEMEMSRMFDLLMEAKLERHLVVRSNDYHNIVNGRFDRLCKYCAEFDEME